jgi:predicted ATPase
MPPEICRKLDGIALAIELAAGRAAIFGDELSEASDRRESAARGRF